MCWPQQVQWVGEEDWLYRAIFCVTDRISDADQPELVFECLDTICDVYLNGSFVASSDNMHVPLRVPLNLSQLNSDDPNVLVLVFKSAFVYGRKKERDTLGKGQHMRAWNGDPSRVFVRKAGYHYGWDWGNFLSFNGSATLWRLTRASRSSASHVGSYQALQTGMGSAHSRVVSRHLANELLT